MGVRKKQDSSLLLNNGTTFLLNIVVLILTIQVVFVIFYFIAKIFHLNYDTSNWIADSIVAVTIAIIMRFIIFDKNDLGLNRIWRP